MQSKHIIMSLAAVAILAGLTAGLLTGCVCSKCQKQGREATQDELMAKAKVSKADAEKIALTKAPGGTVKDSELEMEKGRLIWSFGFTTPDSKNITEVNVDAITGAIVNVESETPAAEAKEAAKEKKEKSEDKD